MVKQAIFIGCIFILVLLAGLSHAEDLNGLQPPTPYGVFSTHTAESPEKGRAAIDFSYESFLNSSFYRFASNVAFGLKDNLEVSFSVSDQRDGFEDIAFGLKHRIIDKGPQGPSLAYLVTASIDAGIKELSTGGRYGGGLILSERVGPVYAHFNIFYALPGDFSYEGEFRASVGLVFAASNNKWLLGEVYARSSHYSDDIDQFEARFGYRVLISDNLYADLGMGIDFRSNQTDYRFMASLAFLYPQKGKKIRRIYEGM